MTADRLVAAGRIEPVAADDEGAEAALEEAARHADSAESIAANDPNGAYQLAYDGARKAIAAHMRRAGFRVRRGEGAHAITAEYARDVIDPELGKRFDSMRRRRNRSEYGSAFFSEEEVEGAVAVARALVTAVARGG